MNRMLRVSDKIDRAFLVDMPLILVPLSPDAHALQWRMLVLGEVMYQERWDLNLPFIERRLAESEDGVELSFVRRGSDKPASCDRHGRRDSFASGHDCRRRR